MRLAIPTAARMTEPTPPIVRFPRDAGSPLDESALRGPSRIVRDRLVRLAYRFLWNQDDAEDVVQDALVKAHQHEHELRDADKWWSWVCRIVVHACHTHGRRKQIRAKHEPILRQRARAESAGNQHVRSDSKTDVLHHIAGLPKRQREVLVLRHLEEMSYERISQVLGISAATARVHAQAARESLRQRLLRDAGELCGRGRRKDGTA